MSGNAGRFRKARRVGAEIAALTAFNAVALAGAARAQTFRVIPLVTGSSIARDINENGDVCGEKPGLRPGFVSLDQGSDPRLLRETLKVPVAFSPNGYFLATNQGALFRWGLDYLDGSYANMATNLPSQFIAHSISDSCIIVGNVAQIAYFRDLYKQPSDWQGAGYFGRLVSYGTPGPLLSACDATCINGSNVVGGWGTAGGSIGPGSPYQFGGPEYPFAGGYEGGSLTLSSGLIQQRSLEKGAIFDLNENNVGAGYLRSTSDPTCVFPAIMPPLGPGQVSASGERKFLGQTQYGVVPNTEGRVTGLNDYNEGVGWSQMVGDATKTKYACLFTASGTGGGGETKALASLLEKRAIPVVLPGGMKTYWYLPSLWHLRADLPMDINNHGDIAATATYDTDPTPRAVLLKRL